MTARDTQGTMVKVPIQDFRLGTSVFHAICPLEHSPRVKHSKQLSSCNSHLGDSEQDLIFFSQSLIQNIDSLPLK